MADSLRISPRGPAFMVSQNAGVTVGVYNTEQEAQLAVEDCERDDFMLQTARSLVDVAVETHMRLHNIDRRTACGWIKEAAAEPPGSLFLIAAVRSCALTRPSLTLRALHKTLA